MDFSKNTHFQLKNAWRKHPRNMVSGVAVVAKDNNEDNDDNNDDNDHNNNNNNYDPSE